MDNVLASGYVITQIAMVPNDRAGTVEHDMTMALVWYRARFAILAFNPMALFTASFQLSFAATAILVIWYEPRTRRELVKWHWICHYPMALIIMSCLSAMATAPFAAQHFGTVTPWGLVANIIGIPLTGLWIMPTGMILTISGLFGLDWLVVSLMTVGLHAVYYPAD